MMEIRDKAAIFTAPLLAVRPCLADTVATGHPAKMFLKATRPVRPFGPSLVIFVRATLRRRRRFLRCVSDTINHVIDRADNVAENGSIFEPPRCTFFAFGGLGTVTRVARATEREASPRVCTFALYPRLEKSKD